MKEKLAIGDLVQVRYKGQEPTERLRGTLVELKGTAAKVQFERGESILLSVSCLERVKDSQQLKKAIG